MPFSSRRAFVKHSIFGTLLVSVGHSIIGPKRSSSGTKDDLFYRYPAASDEEVSGVVGAAHSNFDKVKSLVDKKPELAKAAWDWGFGDWESALGAASHMGRKDIAEYLIENGARPNIYTYAMLGNLSVVKSMIEASPGIQKQHGPHGFTLMHHATMRLRRKMVSEEELPMVNELIAYLEGLGDADIGTKSLDISDAEKEMYLGEFRFGPGETEIFEVKLNMRKMLSIGRKGDFGRGLNRIDEHIFTPGGGPSIQISFKVENGKATSLSVHDPEPLVSAQRIA